VQIKSLHRQEWKYKFCSLLQEFQELMSGCCVKGEVGKLFKVVGMGKAKIHLKLCELLSHGRDFLIKKQG
jgi:hypothetical protein